MVAPGGLCQHDASRHMSLPLTRRCQDLILSKDDLSRLIWGGILVERETGYRDFQVVRSSIERYGTPLVYL